MKIIHKLILFTAAVLLTTTAAMFSIRHVYLGIEHLYLQNEKVEKAAMNLLLTAHAGREFSPSLDKKAPDNLLGEIPQAQGELMDFTAPDINLFHKTLNTYEKNSKNLAITTKILNKKLSQLKKWTNRITTSSWKIATQITNDGRMPPPLGDNALNKNKNPFSNKVRKIVKITLAFMEGINEKLFWGENQTSARRLLNQTVQNLNSETKKIVEGNMILKGGSLQEYGNLVTLFTKELPRLGDSIIQVYQKRNQIIKAMETSRNHALTLIHAIIAQNTQAVTLAQKKANRRMLLAILSYLGITILFAFWIGKGILRSTHNILSETRAIAAGNFTKEITVTSKDEIGQTAKTLRDILNRVVGEDLSLKEGFPFPFFTTNKDLKISYANSQFAEWSGKTMKEIIGQPCGAIVKARQCGTLQCLIKRAYEQETPVCEISVLERDGIPRWYNVSASTIKDLKGDISGAYGFFIDITEYKKAQEAIEKNQETMLGVAQELQEIANQVATAADILSSQSDEIAAGAEEQSAQANQVAAAVEEMNATIAEVAKNAQEAANHSQEARDVATQGRQVVEDSVKKIERLADNTRIVAESVEALTVKSREIDKVIDVISDIADQTNLLALNATIEAASAGEAGKGFAVVAGEIKELAKQTAESTGSVGESIGQIQEGIKNAVNMIKETLHEVSEATTLSKKAGNSLKEILEKASGTAEMVTGIAAAALQQATAVEEISRNVDGIMLVSQQTAEGVAESARAAKELSSMADKLLNSVKQFQG